MAKAALTLLPVMACSSLAFTTSSGWQDVKDFDWSLDEDTLLNRLDNFSSQSRSKEKLYIFADSESDSEKSEKPRVSLGYRKFNWLVDENITKVGYGGRFDALVHTELSQKHYWEDYETYEGELVLSIDSVFMVVWEWFSFYRQAIEIDLSLLQVKPLFFQFTTPDTREMSWLEKRRRGFKTCFGIY